jgi:hypothetical protein
MERNQSSTLAAWAVGDVVVAEHYTDEGVTWLRLVYADARVLWLSPDGSRLKYGVARADGSPAVPSGGLVE